MSGVFGWVRGCSLAVMMAVVVSLSGCATPGAMDAGVQPTSDTTGNESNARTRARIHTELAAGYFDLGNLGVALEEVTIAQQADPNYATTYNVAGLIYAALKDDRRAEENFLRALRLNPADPDANHNYGGFLCQRKREVEGIKFLLAAVQNPLYQAPERSLGNAGICARRRGDDAAAQEFFLRALTVRPNHAPSLLQMAELSFSANNYGAAQGYLRRFSQVAPAGPDVLWLAIRVERKLGNALAEASYAQQLRKNFPESKEAVALQAGRFE